MIRKDPYGISGAVRPWESIDTMKLPDKVHTCDKQEQIDKCLTCTLDDCHPTICKNGGRTQTEWHLRCDALELLKMRWDMILAFPPCTYLSNAGAKHLFRGGRS